MMSEREHAERLTSIFGRTADVLAHSAGLAEEHAQRDERLGRLGHAARERQAAERARDAAQLARLRAASWEELFRELDELERRADERDRRADERERVADDREHAADERERIADGRERAADGSAARRYDDRALGSSGAPHRSEAALRHADEALAYARERVSRLAAERQAREESA